jgi:hypothetical protein
MLRFFSCTMIKIDVHFSSIKNKNLCQILLSKSYLESMGYINKRCHAKEAWANKRCHTKKVCAKKESKTRGAKTPAREKNSVHVYPQKVRKYSPCSQRFQKERGTTFEFMKNTKIFHPLAQFWSKCMTSLSIRVGVFIELLAAFSRLHLPNLSRTGKEPLLRSKQVGVKFTYP